MQGEGYTHLNEKVVLQEEINGIEIELLNLERRRQSLLAQVAVKSARIDVLSQDTFWCSTRQEWMSND